jgi:carbamoyltransferase
MKIISLSLNNHDSSFSIIDGKNPIKHFLAERFEKTKKCEIIFPTFKKYIDQSEEIYDLLIVDVYDKDYIETIRQLDDLNLFLKDNNKIKEVKINYSNHHIYHAYTGFYTSSFDDALCFVFDGNGCIDKDYGVTEIESIFLFKNKVFNKTLYKKYWTFDTNLSLPFYFKNKNITFEPSLGGMYESLSLSMGFSWDSAGKVMGLSQYKHDKKKLQYPYNTIEWQRRVDDAYNLQLYTQDKICKLIETYSEKTGIKNIILTGGVSLNCVSNFNCIKKFPNLNFHVDPICSDKGISLGSCLLNYVQKTRQISERIENVYLGSNEKKIDYEEYNYKKVSYEDVVNLLVNGNIVALFQGKSEVGERSLGNRSLLFDPRIKNGSNIVNQIKQRENFRPFAATILLDCVHEWFDLKSLNESKYMSFAVDAYRKAIDLVPAVIHANNTCRIQTVTEKQNYYFYNLIKTFYLKTKIPMLLNTSFNLAGKPIVETFEDAILTLKQSQIEYLYLPEDEILITIKN